MAEGVARDDRSNMDGTGSGMGHATHVGQHGMGTIFSDARSTNLDICELLKNVGVCVEEFRNGMCVLSM